MPVLRVALGAPLPCGPIRPRQVAAADQHLRSTLEVADRATRLVYGDAGILPGTVEGSRRHYGMRATQRGDVGAVVSGIPQQSQLERIPRTCLEVGLVGERHRHQRARRIDGVHGPHVHPVLGQRTCLVGGDDVDRTKRLDGREAADHRPLPCHPLDAEGERHGQHGWQALRHRGHRQRDGEDDDVRRVGQALGQHAQHAERHRKDEYPLRDLTTQAVHSPLERGLGRRDVAEHAREPSHGTRRPGASDVEHGVAAHEQGAAESLVAGVLVDGDGLARQERLVQHRAAGLCQQAIGRNAVASLDAHAIARHELVHGEAHEMAVAQDPGLRPCHRLEPCQRRLGSLLLVETESRVQHQDQTDGTGFHRPAVGAFVDPHRHVEGQGEQQDVDEWTGELRQQPSPPRDRRALG